MIIKPSFLVCCALVIFSSTVKSAEYKFYNTFGELCTMCEGNNSQLGMDGISFCSGFISGAAQTFNIMQSTKLAPKLICTEIAGKDIQKIIVKYCHEHPEKHGLLPAGGVMDALYAAYPCKAETRGQRLEKFD